MLPGDEIIEKKHGNIKMLTAQMESADLGKKATRKWDGLGKNVFEIDYPSLFPDYKDLGPAVPEGGEPPKTEIPKNELTSEIEIQNTP